MNAQVVFVHALSPLHAGTGQGVGVIDLPIAREKATGIPFLPGSSLKGSLRDLCPENRRDKIFGPEKDNASDYAGSAQFSDQRLLLLPIRSLAGTFAWVTSPYLLQRFARDLQSAGLSGFPNNIPSPTENRCSVSSDGNGQACKLIRENNQVYLEDLDLTADKQAASRSWAEWIGKRVFPNDTNWQRMFNERFCIVNDDILNFLLDTATEITARVKLRDDEKTVQKGGLWYEEALPAETILSGLVVATVIKKNGQINAQAQEVFNVIKDLITKNGQAQAVQFGGKATVGRGLCHVRMSAN